LKQGNVVLASGQAHYTQRRMCGLLGVEFETIPCTSPGQMDVALLENRCGRSAARNCGTPVEAWIPITRGRRVRRLLHPCRQPLSGNEEVVRYDR
jgi:glutamate/tyrosine decarboxylase-like PLP-dependent enzyme